MPQAPSSAARISRLRAVVDDQHPDVSHHRRRQVRAIGLPFLAQRETGREVERAPPIDLALHPDTAPHQVDELGGDRQAEAGAAVAPGHGAVGLDEGGEDRRLLLPWNADSGIAHREVQDGFTFGPGFFPYPHDDLAVLRELDGIPGQVADDLAQPPRVAQPARSYAVARVSLTSSTCSGCAIIRPPPRPRRSPRRRAA